jgi:PKD repeat protein
MLIGSIVALFLLAAILFVGFFIPPSLAMAQLQQQQTTTTTTTGTVVATPPLTPQEQEQQNRLQNVIAATTRDLNETEKQVSGVVFTPRWSEPLWVNANSIAVLVAYCLPGEFADSGQEILGGFELEVLESYAVDLPQGFMAWMAVVGNEGDQLNRRFPAAVGVICASDLNNPDTRILSPQEQQEINNINQQFTTIQNTQITNIDQVINIIDDVTEPTTEGQPLTVEATANATEAYVPVTIRFDSKVTGGTPPYSYTWRSADGGGVAIGYQRNLVIPFDEGAGGTDIIILNVTDSKNQTASDTVPISIKQRPPTNDTGGGGTPTGQPFRVKIIASATQAYTPAYIEVEANVTGGTPPYSYDWDLFGASESHERRFIVGLHGARTYTFNLYATDSEGRGASDSVLITVEEPPPPGEGGVLLPPETGQEGQSPGGGGLLPGIAPGEEEEQQPQAPPTVPEEGEPTTGSGEEEEDTGGAPPPDDTGEEGEGAPPSTTEEEPTTPPEGGG